MNRLAALVILTALAAFPARAEDAGGTDDADSGFTTVTKDGLVFRVPADMPIERRDGIVAPVPYEEYAQAKFKKLEARIAAIESRIERNEKSLKRILSRTDTRALSTD